MSVTYLDKPIAESRRDNNAHPRLTRDGYTLRAGSPTPYMIRLEGEKIWRRLMCWQFSNAGTCFIRINKQAFVVRDIPPCT